MTAHERTEDGMLFVRLSADRVDTSNAPALRTLLTDRIGDGHQIVVLNLEEVKFMDSCGLGVIASALRLLRGRGELILCGLREGVSSVLRVTGMDQILPVFESEQQAKEWRASRRY